MKHLQTIICTLCLGLSCFSQSIDDLSFGTDSTFEVIAWNIERFPKNGQTTVNYVIDIIEALDVDILAIQEVDNISNFEQMLDSLSGYVGYLESSWFAGLAYIYKSDVIQVNDIYEIYTTSQYRSPFPRSPMVLDCNYMDERIFVINNHFKCCGNGIMDITDDGDEETRRYIASNLLKEYIDTHFPDENVIMLGDLNDLLSDSPGNDVFQSFMEDPENYLFADYDIATGTASDWSFPNWPSHLDHILITDELFDDFENESSAIKTIKIDENFPDGWWAYDNNVSDHRPVALKLEMNSPLGVAEFALPTAHFKSHPNPFNASITLTYDLVESADLNVNIYNLRGELVWHHSQSNHPAGEGYSLTWNGLNLNGDFLSSGVYLVRIQSGGQNLTRKVTLLR